ncbi:hypothetical protein HID58_029623 [Brassica napus]|uniref:F-box associated beta-propeller type 3 domain-containing protein n=1 Tax=Brassica napus TaxID=3708 RepID=A0ABQ8CDL0_BRANA|nr:hypothetical protein HID58_029623 [Brassica napus]
MFVGMTGTGEIVVSALNRKPFYVSFYNVESKSFNRVYIQGLEEFNHDTFVDYVENMKFI